MVVVREALAGKFSHGPSRSSSFRILTPDDYGLMALATATASFLFFLNELGLVAGLIQAPDLSERQIRGAFSLVLLVNVLCFMLLYVVSVPLSSFYANPALVPVTRILSLQFIISMFSVVPSALLMREMRFKKLSFLDLASQIFGATVTLVLALAGQGIWSLVWGQLTIAAVKSVLYNWAGPTPGWPALPGRDLRGLLTFGGIVTFRGCFGFSTHGRTCSLSASNSGKRYWGSTPSRFTSPRFRCKR